MIANIKQPAYELQLSSFRFPIVISVNLQAAFDLQVDGDDRRGGRQRMDESEFMYHYPPTHINYTFASTHMEYFRWSVLNEHPTVLKGGGVGERGGG